MRNLLTLIFLLPLLAWAQSSLPPVTGTFDLRASEGQEFFGLTDRLTLQGRISAGKLVISNQLLIRGLTLTLRCGGAFTQNQINIDAQGRFSGFCSGFQQLTVTYTASGYFPNLRLTLGHINHPTSDPGFPGQIDLVLIPVVEKDAFLAEVQNKGVVSTAEWESAKRRKQGLEQNLAGQAIERDRQLPDLGAGRLERQDQEARLAEAKERERQAAESEQKKRADQEAQRSTEFEAERRKLRELEQRLLAEAKERERQAAESEQKKRIEAEARQAAELEVERRKRQELEGRLAAEASERGRLLAEAKERERVLAEAKEREKVATPQRPQAALKPERRVALVIGNAGYKTNPLLNSGNDAIDIATALGSLGFETTLVRDATIGQMREVTRKFADAVALSDVALIFYAGHGLEVKGRNYLIPVTADIKHGYELEDQAYDAGCWLDMLEGMKSLNRQRVNIVILDACRDNVFSRGWRNASRGLARMDAPTGTFIAFATAPGKVAADGERQRNSPFTKSLLKAIQQPNLPIELMFKEVRRMVLEETKGEQVPWDNSSLVGDFAFRR